jgi:hypothetical protein
LNTDVQTITSTIKPTATNSYLTSSATTNHVVNIDLNVGLPDVSGKVLSSTTAGALSWIESGGGGGGNMFNPSIANLNMDSNSITNVPGLSGVNFLSGGENVNNGMDIFTYKENQPLSLYINDTQVGSGKIPYIKISDTGIFLGNLADETAYLKYDDNLLKLVGTNPSIDNTGGKILSTELQTQSIKSITNVDIPNNLFSIMNNNPVGVDEKLPAVQISAFDLVGTTNSYINIDSNTGFDFNHRKTVSSVLSNYELTLTEGNLELIGTNTYANTTIKNLNGDIYAKDFVLSANTLGQPNNIITFGDTTTQDTAYKALDIQTLAGVEKTLGGTPFLTAVVDGDDSHKWNIDLNVAYPDTTGKVLSSTTTGVLSWVSAGGGGGGSMNNPSTANLDMADFNIINATKIEKDDDIANLTNLFDDVYTPTNSTLFVIQPIPYTSGMFDGKPVIASGNPFEPDVAVPAGCLLTYFYNKGKDETLSVANQSGNIWNINALQSSINIPSAYYQFLVGGTLQLTNTTIENYPIITAVNFISTTEYGLFFIYNGIDTPTIDNLVVYLPDTISPPVPVGTTISSSTYTPTITPTQYNLTITTNNNIGLISPIITQDEKVYFFYNLTISYPVPNSSIQFGNQQLTFNAGGGGDMVLTKTALQLPTLSIEPENIIFTDATIQTTAFTNPFTSVGDVAFDMNNKNITNVNTITTTTCNATTASITTTNTGLITPNIKNSLTELSTKSLFINSANTIENYLQQNTDFTFNYNGDKVYYLFSGEAKLYILDYSLPNPLTNFTTIENSDLAGVYAVSNPVGNPVIGEFIYFLSYAEGSFHRLIKYYLFYNIFEIVAELDPLNALWDRTNNLVATLLSENSDAVFLYIGNLNKITAPETVLITIYKISASDGTITPQDINVPNAGNAELILTSYIPFIDYSNLLPINTTGVCLAIKATDNSLSYIALYLWDTSVSQYFLYWYSLPKLNTPVNTMLQTYADANTSQFSTPTGICVAYGDNTVYTYNYMGVLPEAELSPDYLFIEFTGVAGLMSILNLTAKTVANPALPFQKIGKFRSCYAYFTLLNFTQQTSSVYFVNMNPLLIRRSWEFTSNTNSIGTLTYNNKNNCLFGIFQDTLINFFIDGSSGFSITDNLTITTSLNIASDYNYGTSFVRTTKNCGIVSLTGSQAIIYNPLITPYSVILLTKQSFGHPNGVIAISSKNYGDCFITSTNNNDNDTVAYMICNS